MLFRFKIPYSPRVKSELNFPGLNQLKTCATGYLPHLNVITQTSNLAKHLRWSVLRKYLTAFSRYPFSQNTVLEIWQGSEYASVTLPWNKNNQYRKVENVFILFLTFPAHKISKSAFLFVTIPTEVVTILLSLKKNYFQYCARIKNNLTHKTLQANIKQHVTLGISDCVIEDTAIIK